MSYTDDYGNTLTDDSGSDWQPTTTEAGSASPELGNADNDLLSGAQFAMNLVNSFASSSPTTGIVDSPAAQTPAQAAKVGGTPIADQVAARAQAPADNPWSFDGILKMANNIGSFVKENPVAAIALGGAGKALLDRDAKNQLNAHYERSDAAQQQLADLAKSKQENAATSGQGLKVNAGSSTPKLGLIGGYLERRKRNLTASQGG